MSIQARREIRSHNENFALEDDGGSGLDGAWWGNVMEWVMERGSVIGYAPGLSPGIFRNWIAADEKREAAYLGAVARCKEMRIARASERVFEIADREHRDVTPGDTLKAAGMLLEKGGVSVAAEGGGKITIIHESQ